MLIVFGSQKGGAGKTTLATSCAAALAQSGRGVVLVDADPQGTATQWALARASQPDLSLVRLVQRSGDLFAELRALRREAGDVVVDTGGADTPELRTALCAADVFVSPLRPSQADLWTTSHVEQIAIGARAINPGLSALWLLSQAPTHAWADEAGDAATFLAESSLRLCSTVVFERKAYRAALMRARGATESTDRRAAGEIAALLEEIHGEVSHRASA
jgi:chromosome partitioning protein